MRKHRILRFAPHQNGKVVGLIAGVVTLVFALPFMLLFMAGTPDTDAQGNPVDISWWVFLLLPLAYFVFGYVFTVIWCWIYNLIGPRVGGFEFDSADQ